MKKTVMSVLLVVFILSLAMSVCSADNGGATFVIDNRIHEARVAAGLDDPNYKYDGPGPKFMEEPVYGMQTWKSWSH